MTIMLEEKKEIVMDKRFIPIVKNEVDSPDNLSVTTVNPLPEDADEEKVAKIKEDETTPSIEAAEETKGKAAIPETEKKEEVSEESLHKVKKTAEKQREDDPVQRRINEITKKRREAERELEFERKKREEVEAELEKAKANIPLTGKPKVEDFETEESYSEALMDWKIENRLKTDKEKTTKASTEKSEKDQFTANLNAIETKMEKGSEKYEDFSELVLNNDLKISDSMVDILVTSEIAEDVLYYLGKNPDISADIAKKSPVEAAREIGRIEARLLAPPLRKKITNAPEPINPVRTTGVTEKDPSDMPPKEYRAWRERK